MAFYAINSQSNECQPEHFMFFEWNLSPIEPIDSMAKPNTEYLAEIDERIEFASKGFRIQGIFVARAMHSAIIIRRWAVCTYEQLICISSLPILIICIDCHARWLIFQLRIYGKNCWCFLIHEFSLHIFFFAVENIQLNVHQSSAHSMHGLRDKSVSIVRQMPHIVYAKIKVQRRKTKTRTKPSE